MAKEYKAYDPNAGRAQKGDSTYLTSVYNTQKQYLPSGYGNAFAEWGLEKVGGGEASGGGEQQFFDGQPWLSQDGQPVYSQPTYAAITYRDKETGKEYTLDSPDGWSGYTDGDFGQMRQDQEDYAMGKLNEIPLFGQMGGLEENGVKYGNKAKNSLFHREQIVANLNRYGVSDLADLGSTTDANGKTVFYNRLTGQQLDERIGYSAEGEGFTNYKLVPVAGGGAVPVAMWEDSSDNAQIAQGLALAAMVVAPWALPAIGAAAGLGAVGAGALYGGATGALTAGLTGGDVLKSGLTGAVAGGIGGGIGTGSGQFNVAGSLGDYGAAATRAINSGAQGALRGGLSAGVNGGSIAQGALTGAVAGSAGSMIGTAPGQYNAAEALGADGTFANAINSGASGALRGGLSAATQGGDVLSGALSGGASGGISGLASTGLQQAGFAPPAANSIAGQIGNYGGQAVRGAMADNNQAPQAQPAIQQQPIARPAASPQPSGGGLAQYNAQPAPTRQPFNAQEFSNFSTYLRNLGLA